jgi:hypothetical protein
MTKILKANITTAYIISIPLGLICVFFTLAAPVMITQEAMFYFLIIPKFGLAILGLILSFFFAIQYGSKKAHQKLIDNESILKASFIFSLNINTIIWATFIFITFIQIAVIYLFEINSPFHETTDSLFMLIYGLAIPTLFYLLSTIGTTFSVGLLVSYLFKKNITKNISLS